jgi:hypothetical protein
MLEIISFIIANVFICLFSSEPVFFSLFYSALYFLNFFFIKVYKNSENSATLCLTFSVVSILTVLSVEYSFFNGNLNLLDSDPELFYFSALDINNLGQDAVVLNYLAYPKILALFNNWFAQNKYAFFIPNLFIYCILANEVSLLFKSLIKGDYKVYLRLYLLLPSTLAASTMLLKDIFIVLSFIFIINFALIENNRYIRLLLGFLILILFRFTYLPLWILIVFFLSDRHMKRVLFLVFFCIFLIFGSKISSFSNLGSAFEQINEDFDSYSGGGIISNFEKSGGFLSTFSLVFNSSIWLKIFLLPLASCFLILLPYNFWDYNFHGHVWYAFYKNSNWISFFLLLVFLRGMFYNYNSSELSRKLLIITVGSLFFVSFLTAGLISRYCWFILPLVFVLVSNVPYEGVLRKLQNVYFIYIFLIALSYMFILFT